MEKSLQKRILELDALRGVAALCVVIFHYTLHTPYERPGFFLGITGVDLFFIISGFVILLTLTKTKRWQDFLINRFSRLYPTYWVCVMITFLAGNIYLIHNHRSTGEWSQSFAPNLTMFQAYFNRYDLDASYWTLLVEMLFYVYMGVIFISGGLKAIERIALLTLLPIIFYSTPYFSSHLPGLHSFLGRYVPLFYSFPLFFAGILFYKSKTEGQTLWRYVLLTLCFGCQLCLYKERMRGGMFVSFVEYIAMLTLFYGLFVLYLNNGLGVIVNRATLFLGEISYSLYLLHQYIGVNVVIRGVVKYGHVHFFLGVVVAVLQAIVLAWIVTILIEKPATRLIRTALRRRKREVYSEATLTER